MPPVARPTSANYHCFGGSDFYNYQPFNLLITPSERSSFFTMLNYKINDKVEAYGEVLYSRTTAGFNLASLPFDANADDVDHLRANSYYNPFGFAFGGVEGIEPEPADAPGGARQSPQRSRNRKHDRQRRSARRLRRQHLGVGCGRAARSHGPERQRLRLPARTAAAAGARPIVPRSGAPAASLAARPAALIAGCTPINIFNVEDPAQIAALRDISTNYRTDYVYESQGYSLNANGELFDIPGGGAVLMAVGAEYRTQRAGVRNRRADAR